MSEEQEEICRKVRSMVRSLIRRGAEPSDISFALSFIATELGLEVTEGSISVFPVLMSGITHAVANTASASADNEDAAEEDVPIGAILH